MKTVKLFLTCLVFTFSVSFSSGQSWEWAKAGISYSPNSFCDIYSIAADAKGNIFESGQFSGSIIYGSDTIRYVGTSSSVVLIKYDSLGNVLWANYGKVSSGACFGNSYSVTTDNAGNAYITGIFSDTIAFGSFTLVSNNGGIFIVKYAPNGNVIWAKQNIQGNNVGASSVAVDNASNSYVTGTFQDTIHFGTQELLPTGTSVNVFLVKYDSNGNAIWAQSGEVGANTSSDVSNSVATDKEANIYITGTFFDTISFGPYLLTAHKHPGSIFLVKYDSGGHVIWAKSSNASLTGANAIPYSVVTDNGSNVYITGQFKDSLIFGSFTIITGYMNDIFLVKYDSIGSVIWAYSGNLPNPNSTGIGYSLSADRFNRIYLGGSFEGSISFDSVGLSSPMGTCIFMFDTSGKALCGTSVNMNNDDQNAIAADPWGGGVYLGADIPGASDCIFGNDTISNSGDEYSFLAKWQPCTNIETSINPLPEKTSISLFPNPNSGVFTLQVKSEELTAKSNIEIYNVLGEQVYNATLNQVQGDNLINLSNQPNGVYLYRVLKEDGELIGSGKVVIEKED